MVLLVLFSDACDNSLVSDRMKKKINQETYLIWQFLYFYFITLVRRITK